MSNRKHDDDTRDAFGARLIRSLGIGAAIYMGSAVFSAFFLKVDIAKSWWKTFQSELRNGTTIFASVGTATLDYLLHRSDVSLSPNKNDPTTDVPIVEKSQTNARWSTKISSRDPLSEPISHASAQARSEGDGVVAR